MSCQPRVKRARWWHPVRNNSGKENWMPAYAGMTDSALQTNCKKQSRGFTLIEILIVIFIISIVTSVAMLSISRNENKQIESFANELTQMLTLAEEQAMLQPSVMGLTFKQQTLQFSALKKASDGKDEWQLLRDNVLGEHRIPDNIEINIDAGGKKINEADEVEKKLPQVVISTSGDLSPFTIYIGKKGKKPRYAIIGSADGKVTNKELT
ncbi:MAG: hypothetical protein ACD_46C00245G0001, partial [uncultured bacterium]